MPSFPAGQMQSGVAFLNGGAPAPAASGAPAPVYGSAEYWADQQRQGKPTPPWYQNGRIVATKEYYEDQARQRAGIGGDPTGAQGGTGLGAAALKQQTGLGTPFRTDDELRKWLLSQQGGQAGKFADQSQDSYTQLGKQGQGALSGLQAIANGQRSVSAEQLRQGMQQGLAQQQSIAAGAAPQDAAGAARTAAIQSGRLSSGLSGQQALAGLQERNQAQGQYGQLLGTLRGQDVNAASSARAAAASSYGAGNAGPPTPGWWDENGKYVQAGASAVAAAFSDRRLKTDIRDGDEAANRAIKGMKSYLFKYKDEAHGAGDQVGVMAQDLERAGLGHAVIDTPAGKMVHGAKLSTANTAMIGALARRLEQLEQPGEVESPSLARRRAAAGAQARLAQDAKERAAMRGLSRASAPSAASGWRSDSSVSGADAGGE